MPRKPFFLGQPDYHNLLIDLIKSDKLQLVSIITLPRCRGTILSRSLAQAAQFDGLAHEAFFPKPLFLKTDDEQSGDTEAYFNYDPEFQRGCQYLYEYYFELSKGNENEKISLCLQDFTGEFSERAFKKMLGLTNHMIFAFREPSYNLKSFIVGQTNYLLSDVGELPSQIIDMFISGDFNLSAHDLSQLLGEGPGKISKVRLLQAVNKHQDDEATLADLSTARVKLLEQVAAYFGQCWEKFPLFYSQAEEFYRGKMDCSIQLIETSTITTVPEQTLKNLCQPIPGIDYSRDMLENLTKFSGDKFKSYSGITLGHDERFRAIWLGNAISSVAIQVSEKKAPLPLEALPKELHSLLSEANGIYQKMLSEPSCIHNETSVPVTSNQCAAG